MGRCRTLRCAWGVPIIHSVELKRASGAHGQPGTLGDLLHADPAAPAIYEDEWVRLVQSIVAGDQHALRALYERTHRLVFTLAIRITGNRETAEEIALDVFHDVWRRAVHYDPKGGSVVGWIMNQTRSRAIDRLRFDHRQKRVSPSLDQAQRTQVDLLEPSDAVAAAQRRSALENALAALTRNERQAIEVAFFGELSYSETAARLDQPVGTVKTRIRTALAKLRDAIGSEGDR